MKENITKFCMKQNCFQIKSNFREPVVPATDSQSTVTFPCFNYLTWAEIKNELQ